MNAKILFTLITIILAVGTTSALTGTTTTIRFEITSATSMSISYQSPCSQTSFACRWNGGTQTGINITDNSGSMCQNSTAYALRVTNDGTVSINTTMYLNQSVTGATVKYSKDSYNYAGASTLTTSPTQVNGGQAVSTNKDYWFYCDFSNFNGGAAGYVDSKIYHNATQS